MATDLKKAIKNRNQFFAKMVAKATSGSGFHFRFVFYALDLVKKANNVEMEQCNGGPKCENTHLGY